MLVRAGAFGCNPGAMSGVLREGDLVGGRYRLVRLLGEGGFAIVWSATHLVTRRQVALKLLKEEFAADRNVRQRFLREARAASAVRHPNVIAIQDVFEEEGGRPVIVMDLLEGESLGERVRRTGALPLQDTAAVLLPVLSAVECAHGLGIVHRDLKPDNIFLAAGPGDAVAVKVLDFGIAKLTARDGDAARSGGLTRTGALLGTPYYMSPEQIFGDGEVDARSDVWSLGVILYECLAGVRPTQAESIGQIIRMIASDAIVPLAQRKPELPTEVTAVVGRALSFDNEARPALEEVRRVLAGHVDPASRLVVVASDAPPPTGLEDTARASSDRDGRASTQSAVTRPPQETRRRGRTWAAVVVAGIGAIAVGVVWRSSTASQSVPDPQVAADPSVSGASAVIAAPASTAVASAQASVDVTTPVDAAPTAEPVRVSTRATVPTSQQARRAPFAPGASTRAPATSAPPPAPASSLPVDPASYR